MDASVSCLGDVWMRLIARVAHAGAPAQESRPELLRGSARASRERLFMRSSTWDARRPIRIFRVLGLARDSGLITATNKPTIQIQIQMLEYRTLLDYTRSDSWPSGADLCSLEGCRAGIGFFIH